MSTTRFPNGVTNVVSENTLGAMGQLDPTKYFTVFDDLVLDPTAWGTLTAIAGDGGLATIATTVPAVTPVACFNLDTTKELYMKVKLSLAAIATTSLLIGFADDLATPTVGAYLTLVNGVTLSLVLNGAATTSKSVTVAPGAATQFTVGFAYTPNKGFKVYLNDTVVMSQTDITNLDTTTDMIFGVYGTGTTTTLDYLFAAEER